MDQNLPHNSKLLILTGEYNHKFSDYSTVVTVSPLRHALLNLKGCHNHLFGDFSPGQQRGKGMDAELLNKLETCLESEKKANDELRWVPIVFQRLRHCLSYYIWLRECMEKMVQSLEPSHITLSSGEDKEFVFVLQDVVKRHSIKLQVEDGNANDHSTCLFHLVSCNDHPKRMDPLWFIRLHAFCLKFFYPKAEVLYQEYWNINGWFDKKRHVKFNQHKAFNYINFTLIRIVRILKREPIRTIENNVFPNKDVPRLLKSKEWDCFSDTEKLIVNYAVERFLKVYPPKFMDRLAEGARIFFTTLKPKRIILNADQNSSARFLSQVAHELGIKVDCLPHGLALEDVSGPCLGSQYMPDRFLSWGTSSQETYKELGWLADPVIHPRVSSEKRPYEGINKSLNELRILYFAPEWGGLTLDSRKDCFEKTILEVLNGLRMVGIPDENLIIKYHPDQPFGNNVKLKTLLQLKSKLGMNFTIYGDKIDTFSLIPQYDLIISGVTTGIFEAVLLGKPVILFGSQVPRIGALNKHSLPYAVTAEEIARCLENFDNKRVAESCRQISESLQTGLSLTSL